MSNDKNIFERLFKLWAMICKMIMDGVRDPDKVAEILQTIVDQGKGKFYLHRLYKTKVIKLGDVVFAVYEQVLDGTLAQLFGSLGEDLNRFCFLSCLQVDAFCRVHSDKLRREDGMTFFLYKERGNFFVTYAQVEDDGHYYLCSGMLVDAVIWIATHRNRLVIPL